MFGIKKRVFKNFDFLTLLLSLLCGVYGLVLVYSAVNNMEGSKNFAVQVFALVLSVVVFLIILLPDYKSFGKRALAIFIVSLLMLAVVLFIGIGRSETGTQGWIRFGYIGVQPSELVKILFIITFAKHLDAVGDTLNRPSTLIVVLLHLACPLLLIALQPDFGTAMVFVFIAILLLFYAGIKYRYVFGCLGLFAASAPIFWNMLGEFQKTRVRVFLNPELDPIHGGYNVLQSKLAIGSGQLFGKGFLQGTQIQLDYLPGKHTDFIFAVAGEEFGFIGSTVILLLLFALIVRCIYVSQIAKDRFGSYLCMGVAGMFLFHVVENIGMCIGLMPVTGIPLPFFSYGGSSLLTSFLGVALVANVYMRRKTYYF